MYIQFNAFIPGYLGLPLRSAIAFQRYPKFENEDYFDRKLDTIDSFTGYTTWALEPYSDNQFFCTDNRDFGEHNIYLSHTNNRESRLYIYPPVGNFKGIDLSKIGKMHASDKIFKLDCGTSRQVTVSATFDSKNAPIDDWNNRNLVNTSIGCHYGNYRGLQKYYADIEEEHESAYPYGLLGSHEESISNMGADCTVISLHAGAGFPFTEPFSPNIDIYLNIDMRRLSNSYKIEISGRHNLFPYYEMLIDGTIVYKYIPLDNGPDISNLNDLHHFSYTQTYPKK